MSGRQKYHVVPKADDWQVKRTGADRASKTFDNKQDAIDYGKDRAKDAPLGQLVIHKKDGTIQTEYTYGKDPYPPKG